MSKITLPTMSSSFVLKLPSARLRALFEGKLMGFLLQPPRFIITPATGSFPIGVHRRWKPKLPVRASPALPFYISGSGQSPFSFCQNVNCGIMIPVMCHPALGTCPDPYGQILNLHVFVSAAAAYLTARKES